MSSCQQITQQQMYDKKAKTTTSTKLFSFFTKNSKKNRGDTIVLQYKCWCFLPFLYVFFWYFNITRQQIYKNSKKLTV